MDDNPRGHRTKLARRRPIGAEPQQARGVHFRLWAPAAREVAIEVEGRAARPLSAEAGGYFSARVGEARVGDRYRFRLDGGEPALPDPASRFQPEGPHGPSEIVDPGGFAWRDAEWRGLAPERHVIYEMHVGTFTPEGTWDAAARHLPALGALGVTCIEMMPV